MNIPVSLSILHVEAHLSRLEVRGSQSSRELTPFGLKLSF
jgi:hypothetical protein